jgi:hypothetical protein
VQSAGGQDRDRVDILSRQKIINTVMRWNVEPRCERVGACLDRVAYCGQPSPADMIASQQLGMTLCDAATSEQAKSNHDNFLTAAINFWLGYV